MEEDEVDYSDGSLRTRTSQHSQGSQQGSDHHHHNTTSPPAPHPVLSRSHSPSDKDAEDLLQSIRQACTRFEGLLADYREAEQHAVENDHVGRTLRTSQSRTHLNDSHQRWTAQYLLTQRWHQLYEPSRELSAALGTCTTHIAKCATSVLTAQYDPSASADTSDTREIERHIERRNNQIERHKARIKEWEVIALRATHLLHTYLTEYGDTQALNGDCTERNPSSQLLGPHDYMATKQQADRICNNFLVNHTGHDLVSSDELTRLYYEERLKAWPIVARLRRGLPMDEDLQRLYQDREHALIAFSKAYVKTKEFLIAANYIGPNEHDVLRWAEPGLQQKVRSVIEKHRGPKMQSEFAGFSTHQLETIRKVREATYRPIHWVTQEEIHDPARPLGEIFLKDTSDYTKARDDARHLAARNWLDWHEQHHAQSSR